MRIKIKPFVKIKELMDNKSEVVFEFKEQTTLKQLINKLSERYGEKLMIELMDAETNKIKNHYNLLVNGTSYFHLPEKIDNELKDGDVILIFPPLSGG